MLRIAQQSPVSPKMGLKVQVFVKSRQVVWFISRMLGPDEVNSFVLWKTLLWNCVLPSLVDTPADGEILDRFLPFYFEKRLSML